MLNPYESVSTSESISVPAQRLTLVRAMSAALLAALALTLLGLGIHIALRIPVIAAFIENQVWILLVASVFSMACSTLLRRGHRLTMVAKLVCSMIGISIPIFFAAIWIHHFYVGTQSEMIAFLNRALSHYMQIYWAIIVVITVVPAFFLMERVRLSRRASIPACFLIFVASAFFLRANFVIHYAETFPTSWLQFFWPFG